MLARGSKRLIAISAEATAPYGRIDGGKTLLSSGRLDLRERCRAFSRAGWADLAALVVLGIAGMVFVVPLCRGLDLTLHDEGFYLNAGCLIREGQLPRAETAPLYAFHYFLLSHLQPDKARLYVLNWGLLSVISPLLLFAFLRRLRITTAVSLLAASLFLVGDCNFALWPKVAHYGLCVTLSVLLLASLVRRRVEQIAVLCIGALSLSYVRPEIFLAFVLLAGWLIIECIRDVRRRHWRCPGTVVASVAVCSAVAIVLLGCPVGGAGAGSRSYMAFGQHFALNWVAWEKSKLDPWFNWQSIMQQAFGENRTMLQAVWQKPLLVGRHVIANVTDFPRNLLGTLAAIKHIRMGSALQSSILRLGMVTAFSLLLHWRGQPRGQRPSDGGPIIAGLALLVFPGALSAVLIYPRAHYLAGLSLLVPVVATFVAARGREAPSRWRVLIPLSLCVMAVSLVGAGRVRAGDRHNWATIRRIQEMNISQDVYFLDMEAHSFFLPGNYRWVSAWNKNVPCSEYLSASHQTWNNAERGHIKMVLVTDRLARHPTYADDPEWSLFLQNPHPFGFEELPLPVPGKRLFVRKDLAREAGD